VPDAPLYFAHTGGRQIGPITYAELDELAARGELAPTDLVWESGTPEWVPASRLLSFTPRAAPAPPGPPVPLPPRPARPGAPPRERVTFRSVVDDLTSFSFAEMVPLSRLYDPQTLGSKTAWVLLVFGLGPLLLGTLVEDALLRVRLFNFGCGALWTVFFAAAFKTARQSLRLGVVVFFATGIFGILFVSVLQNVPPLSWLYLLIAPERPFPLRLVAYVWGVGLLEEVGKGLILLLLARALGGLADAADGVWYGLMSGLGFGVYEAVAYTEWVNPHEANVLSMATGSPTVGLYAYFITSVVRTVSLPLLHAVWTAIVGYFVGLSFSARRKTNSVLLIGLLIATVLHGLYDAFLSAGMGLVAFLIAALTLLLFLSYRRNADRVVAEVRRADEA
jgi:RsiW-degrading membrane proteinase PrsW (M82 family)